MTSHGGLGPLTPATASGSARAVPVEARALLLAAHEGVADAAAAARRSLAVAWESEAAERFRDEVAALLAELDADLTRLEELAGVLGR
ncbi:hypothetical protein ACQFYA_02190 [Promicromonospora sp. Marseille-Q5078]